MVVVRLSGHGAEFAAALSGFKGRWIGWRVGGIEVGSKELGRVDSLEFDCSSWTGVGLDRMNWRACERGACRPG